MKPYFQDDQATLYHGLCLDIARQLPAQSVDCIVTSPPYYGLRDYEFDGQWGLEDTPEAFIANLVGLFTELDRVLADDGTAWINLADSYSSTGGKRGVGRNASVGSTLQQSEQRTRPLTDLPSKNLMGLPWRVALAVQESGWILRNAIIWNKPNAMPESVTDRLGNRYEYLFLFSKSQRYWFDLLPIREPVKNPTPSGHMFGGSKKATRLNNGSSERRTGSTYDHIPKGGRNPGDVWTIPTQPFPDAHFATYPLELPRRAIAAGCPPQRCTHCGVAPARIVRTEQTVTRTTNGPRSAERTYETAGFKTRTVAAHIADGWQTCDCGAPMRTGIVLDPFNGAGTTGQAAGQLGRRYVGIDGKAEYLDLALRTRLSQPSLSVM